MIGEKIDDRYELLEKLGSHVISTLYKARDLRENKIVAVKLLKEEYSFDQEIVHKFIDRSSAVHEIANLKYIAEVYFSGSKAGKVFTIREYVKGINLKEKLKQMGIKLPLEETKEISLQICEALNAAHSKNVVHAGLHPNNIIITPDDQVKITDFGISLIALLPS